MYNKYKLLKNKYFISLFISECIRELKDYSPKDIYEMYFGSNAKPGMFRYHDDEKFISFTLKLPNNNYLYNKLLINLGIHRMYYEYKDTYDQEFDTIDDLEYYDFLAYCIDEHDPEDTKLYSLVIYPDNMLDVGNKLDSKCLSVSYVKEDGIKRSKELFNYLTASLNPNETCDNKILKLLNVIFNPKYDKRTIKEYIYREFNRKDIPNDITRAAMEEGERILNDPNAVRYDNVDELMKDLLDE